MVCAEVTGFDEQGFFERYHLKRYHASTYRDPAITYDAMFASSMPLLDTGAIPEAVLREDPSVRGRRAYYGNVFDAYVMNIVLLPEHRDAAPWRRGERSARVTSGQPASRSWTTWLRLSRHHDVLLADVPTYKLRYAHGSALDDHA